MAEDAALESSLGERRGTMFEDVILLAFCFVLAVAGMATVVWEFATGRFFNIDGLWLTLYSYRWHDL